MSTQHHVVPDHPHQRPLDPVMSVADWAVDVAVGVLLFVAVAVLAVILALLIII
jgi:hypothetical protein